jgi:hypothetical protein
VTVAAEHEPTAQRLVGREVRMLDADVSSTEGTAHSRDSGESSGLHIRLNIHAVGMPRVAWRRRVLGARRLKQWLERRMHARWDTYVARGSRKRSEHATQRRRRKCRERRCEKRRATCTEGSRARVREVGPPSEPYRCSYLPVAGCVATLRSSGDFLLVLGAV